MRGVLSQDILFLALLALLLIHSQPTLAAFTSCNVCDGGACNAYCSSAEQSVGNCEDCATAANAKCGDGFCQEAFERPTTCSADCKAVGATCSGINQCYQSLCCGNICRADGTTQSCGTNMTQTCSSSGWSNCLCIQGTTITAGCNLGEVKSCQTNGQWGACQCISGTTSTLGCTSGFKKTCNGGSWSACQYDCSVPTACVAPECKVYNSCSATTQPTVGCSYNNAAFGTSCSSGTKYCDSNGGCSLTLCNGVCANPGTTGIGEVIAGKYCANGKTCYACASPYTVSGSDSNTATCSLSCTSDCQQEGATRCSSGKVQTCTANSGCLNYRDTKTCDVACVSGECVECTTNEQCQDTNTCTTNTCSGNKCVSTFNTNTCTKTDGSPGYCSGGDCEECTLNTHCTDDNTCTDDICNNNECTNPYNTNTCTTPSGQTGICNGGGCQCVALTPLYASICTNSTTNNCGATVLRNTNGNPCVTTTGYSGTCHAGECKCVAITPTYPTTCANTTTNNCGQTVTRETNGLACQTLSNPPQAGTCKAGECKCNPTTRILLAVC